MNSIKFTELRRIINKQIPESRREHTEGVVIEALKLAKRYGADVYKAEIAALSHDLFRYISSKEMKSRAEEFNVDLKKEDTIEIIHGKLAAQALKLNLQIWDEDIINAVSFHTTARGGMSLLEKIIFIADAIEPGRDYPGVENLRILAYIDLDEACRKIIESSINYLKNKSCKIHEDTLIAEKYFHSRKGEKMNNKDIALKIAAVLTAKKARDLIVIDVIDRSSFADYLVIATGGSERQVGTLASEVIDRLAEEGVFAKNVEGKQSSGWILMDYGDTIVNIFSEEQRTRYNIEKIWGDCCFLDIEE